jgi:hypothetical protein
MICDDNKPDEGITLPSRDEQSLIRYNSYRINEAEWIANNINGFIKDIPKEELVAITDKMSKMGGFKSLPEIDKLTLMGGFMPRSGSLHRRYRIASQRGVTSARKNKFIIAPYSGKGYSKRNINYNYPELYPTYLNQSTPRPKTMIDADDIAYTKYIPSEDVVAYNKYTDDKSSVTSDSCDYIDKECHSVPAKEGSLRGIIANRILDRVIQKLQKIKSTVDSRW